MEINRQNYEEHFVEYMEGTLTVAQQLEVEKFISANPDLKQELEAFQETVLVADETIVFEKKHLLYRKEVVAPIKPGKIIPLFLKFGTFAAAAAIILFVTFTFLNKNDAVEIKPISKPVALNNNNGAIAHPTINDDAQKNSTNQNTVVKNFNSGTANNTSPKNNGQLQATNSIQLVAFENLNRINMPKQFLHAGKNKAPHLNYPAMDIKNQQPAIAVVPPAATKTSSIFVVASVLATDLYSLSGRTMAFGKRISTNKKVRMGDIAIDLGFVKFTHHPYLRN